MYKVTSSTKKGYVRKKGPHRVVDVDGDCLIQAKNDNINITIGELDAGGVIRVIL